MDIIIVCLIMMGAINFVAAIDYKLFFKFYIVLQGALYICEISAIHLFSRLLPNEEKVEFMEFNPLVI